jgi:2,4-dienoyl-CoA reductase-like NADH-dependent reductase (Old Yellow Enzyme family)
MSRLFSPARIADLEVKNRFVHSATQEIMAGDGGQVTEGLVKRYETLAKGDVGLIVPGDMYINHSGKSQPNQTGIHNDEMIPGLNRLTQAVHQQGGKIVFQLGHAGRQTSKQLVGHVPLGPSRVGRDPINFVKPKEMDEEDIQQTVRDFGKASMRAVEAGADGIRIHAGHGYLVNQFLSPYFNRRTDQWGGSDENRLRFLEQVFLEVQAAVPEGMPILIKLNTHDHTPGRGITPDLAKFYAGRLKDLGIHGVEVTSGAAHYSFLNMCRGDVPIKELLAGRAFWQKPVAFILLKKWEGKYDLVEGYHLEAAKMIKPVLGDVPLFIVGGMRSAGFMESVLNDGYADFISMSRPFIRQPFLVRQIKEGKTDRTSCVSCNKCLAALANHDPVRCYHKGIGQG